MTPRELAALGPRADAAVEVQYRDARYQSDTALSGMWLFLASETLFFGALFLCWCFARHQHPAGFAAAAARSEFALGTANTVLLVSSSTAFAAAVGWARRGAKRPMIAASLVTACLGVTFLAVKFVEWWLDIAAHDLPGPGFHVTSSDAGGEQLFWMIYWIATGLHFIHLLVGIALVGWIVLRVRRDGVACNRTRIEVVGLYWSFVDMIWLVLYPLIYLAGRA